MPPPVFLPVPTPTEARADVLRGRNSHFQSCPVALVLSPRDAGVVHFPNRATLDALNAESFCERCLRCAGHVLTDGNTLLDNAELEMLVILRMNRRFIEFMRDHYPDVVQQLAKQQFGFSVVDPDADQMPPGGGSGGASSSTAPAPAPPPAVAPAAAPAPVALPAPAAAAAAAATPT